MKLSGPVTALSPVFTIILYFLLLVPPAARAELQQSQRGGAFLQANFQYLLSDFAGPVPSQWARLDFDPRQRELYTLDQSLNEIRIYNQQGMEVYAFGGDGSIVAAADVALGDDGAIYLLARDFQRNGIQVLNFRGEPQAVITLGSLPEKYRNFNPDRMKYRDGLFYLLDSRELQIVVLKSAGTFHQAHDLAADFERMAKELDPEKKKALSLEISGFNVGADGSIYFTAPTLFSAFRLKPDGVLAAFGSPGSGPGKFGVVSGIVVDPQGNIYVADRLRSVVMVFAPDFSFLGEFGYRGDRPEDMIVPDDLAIDAEKRRIFVAQAANKGVGVYTVSLERSPENFGNLPK
ncbi:MAG: hypothetical protein NDI73_09305 [Desulfuromonadales bacterium]|nr:hypothetical protein [Desulfuromonadales bacterium]